MKAEKKSSQLQKQNLLRKLLQGALKRKQKTHPKYSLRALARDLEVSPAFIANVLAGKRRLPAKRAAQISHCLELDVHERQQLFESFLLEPVAQLGTLADQRKDPKIRTRAELHPNSDLLSQWYNLAILEGLSLEEPHNSLANLKKRLRLTDTQIHQALKVLKEIGAISDENGQAQKVSKHLYMPTGRSKREIRSFHDKMILKAREELFNKTTEADFHRRLITGFTFTLSPRDLERLKGKVLEFLDSLSREATAVSGSEVYQCNVQFFPLMDKIKT